MRIRLLIFFLLVESGIYSQDTIFIVKQFRVKTTLSQILNAEVSLGLEYVNDLNAFSVGFGYRSGKYYRRDNIPLRVEDSFFDHTFFTNYEGPNAQISYKRYLVEYRKSNRKYFNTELYYKYNKYDTLGICPDRYEMPNKYISERANVVGVRFLFGSEQIISPLLIELFIGAGIVCKIIETNSIIYYDTSGYYGPSGKHGTSSRVFANPTLHVGIKIGLILKKSIRRAVLE